ncbi:hypothetical protein PIB30_098527, partial [Stylosanthes scabra]|nr:hypothetical protein [Stylosanthes scabra]
SLPLPTLSHRPTSNVPSQAARGLAKVAFVASYSLSPRVVPAARSSLMPSPALSSPPLQLRHPRPSQLELKLCAASSEAVTPRSILYKRGCDTSLDDDNKDEEEKDVDIVATTPISFSNSD